MGAQQKFAPKTKPKVLKFDDVLKSANSEKLVISHQKNRNHSNNAAGQDASRDNNAAQNNEFIYQGLNLYRHNNNEPTNKIKEKKSTIIYMGQSAEYDVWRDNNVTYVRHKENTDFEDALYNNENIRFRDKTLSSTDPSIASTPPTKSGKKTSNLNINKIIKRSEFIDFKPKKNNSYNYVYNDITKKLERQTDFEFSNSDEENGIKNIIATGDVKSLSNTQSDAKNVLDYMQWTRIKL